MIWIGLEIAQWVSIVALALWVWRLGRAQNRMSKIRVSRLSDQDQHPLSVALGPTATVVRRHD